MTLSRRLVPTLDGEMVGDLWLRVALGYRTEAGEVRGFR